MTLDGDAGYAEPLLEEELRVSEAIVAVLADAGVEYVIGMPGGLTVPIWRSLHEHPTIRPVLVREESLGSYMAEAHGRLTGRPVVVMGQGEWIVGNAGQGYLESLLGSSPMIILTEMSDGGPLAHHGPYQGGSGDFGAWDTKKALEGVTKRVMVSRHPAQAVQHVQLAIKHATTGDPGPVAVVFDSASLVGRVGPDSVPRLYRSSGYLDVARPAPEPEDVSFALDALRTAARPVILAGNGVRVGGAAEQLGEVARLLDVPVVTTASGKGVVAEAAPYSAGVIGAFGRPSANDLLGDADVVLAIGTKLGPMDTIDENRALLDPSRQLLIHVDVDPLNVGWTTPAGRAIVADAGRFLEQVAKHHDATAERRSSGVIERVVRDDRSDPVFTSDEVPFTPQRTISLLSEALPDDAIVTADAGENRLFMMRWFQGKRPGGYLQPAAGGGMGHAVPTALGAKLAFPNAPVVAVCGDGGFAMSMHGLMTAVEEKLPIGIVVFNNSMLGWVLHGMGKQIVAADLDTYDLAGVARALQCDGVRPESTDELAAAFARLSSLERPLVIDVTMGVATTFKDVLDPIDSRRAETGY